MGANWWRTGLTGDCWNLVSPISIIPLFLSLFPKGERRSPSWRCTTNFPDLGLTSRYAIQGAVFLDTANDTWIHLCVPGLKKGEDNVFFDCMIVFQENQLEPMDGRKGLTSGWNLFDIGLYFLGDTPIGTTIFLGWDFFQGRSPQLEPLDGRKGLTSGWIFLIGLYLFKEIFSKGWEEGENGWWKLEGWSNIFYRDPPNWNHWMEGMCLWWMDFFDWIIFV